MAINRGIIKGILISLLILAVIGTAVYERIGNDRSKRLLKANNYDLDDVRVFNRLCGYSFKKMASDQNVRNKYLTWKNGDWDYLDFEPR
jgi:hypothetical protein